jgi:hypothetical protein
MRIRAGTILTAILVVAVGAIIVMLTLQVTGAQSTIRQLQQDRNLLELQKTGPAGLAGKNATDSQVAAAVAAYCAAHDNCAGVQGSVGKTGAQGPTGLTGAAGAAGKSTQITQVRCNGTSISFLDAAGNQVGQPVKLVCLN